MKVILPFLGEFLFMTLSLFFHPIFPLGSCKDTQLYIIYNGIWISYYSFMYSGLIKGLSPTKQYSVDESLGMQCWTHLFALLSRPQFLFL